MNRLIQATEGYRMARLKVAVNNPASEYRIRLEALDDPRQTVESPTLTPNAESDIEFSVDTGGLDERAWRVVLVKTPTPEALAIIEATKKAQRGEAEPPVISAEQIKAAGLPLETPLGTIRTRDPLEQVFAVAPARALEHVRTFSQAKGWSDADHDAFVQNLREMGLATWRTALGREVSERQAMLSMLEGMV